MKKKLYLTIALLAAPAVCGATTYWAAPGLAHETFTALIADIEEQDGDIIYLQRGVTYAETLNIYANLDIRPFGTGAMPVIDATGLDWGAIIWNAKTCKITGIEVKGSNAQLLAIEAATLGVWQVDGVKVHSNLANPCITVSGSGWYVKNSEIYECANGGIFGINATAGLAENNHIYDVVTNDSITLHDGTGTDNILRGNVTNGAPENEVDIQAGYTNTIVEDSDLSGSAQYVFLNFGAGTILRRTRLHDSARGAYTAAQMISHHNYFYNLDDATYGSLGGISGFYFTGAADGSSSLNDTFKTSNQATGRPVIYAETGADNLAIENDIFDVNKAQRTLQFVDAAPVGLVCDCNSYNSVHTVLAQTAAVTYANLAAWQVAGQDANSDGSEQYLDTQGRPTAKTPATIKRGGVLLDGYASIAGKYGYIGAYPYYEGTITPWNIALSIMGGPGRLGGGTVYNAPMELVTFGGESATFGGETATW
ncbi:MAG: right-handed parallel beta-helix repeat-containing protein [Patescibacteria group bacterium]